MDNPALYASSQNPILRSTPNPRTNPIISTKPSFCSYKILKKYSISALSRHQDSTPPTISTSNESLGKDLFARISNSRTQLTSSVGAAPQIPVPLPPSSSQVGSPLFWVGVGVAFSAAFSWAASYLQKYAMQQAFNTMMGTQNNQFPNAGFSPGSPFPFPSPAAPGSPPGSPFTFPPSPASGSAATSAPRPFATSAPASQRTMTVDVPPTKTDEPPAPANSEVDFELPKEPKKSAFIDVSPEVTLKTSYEKLEESTNGESPKDSQFANQASQNGSAFKPTDSSFEGASSTGTQGSVMSEAWEKMMEDPNVQKMVYPNSKSGKFFDINSPEVRQQLAQVGLTPEEVMSRITANPDVVMAFQNPRVQAAFMDCSQNPMSIMKYQNDKEVMDAVFKIQELFLG